MAESGKLEEDDSAIPLAGGELSVLTRNLEAWGPTDKETEFEGRGVEVLAFTVETVELMAVSSSVPKEVTEASRPFFLTLSEARVSPACWVSEDLL